MTKDDRLTPIRPRIRELQREVDELEWDYSIFSSWNSLVIRMSLTFEETKE
jgi:hypothetical protein